MTDVSERASLEQVREFCNTVRKAGAANPLDALLEAVPQESNACLIAKNLNFSCQVGGPTSHLDDYSYEVRKRLGFTPPERFAAEEVWAMIVEDQVLADKISEAIQSEYKTINTRYGNKYEILLPYKLGLVAAAYDRVYDEFMSGQEIASEDEELVKLIRPDIIKDTIQNLYEDGFYGEEFNEDGIVYKLIQDYHKELAQERV